MQPRNPHNAALILFALAAATCYGAGWSSVWPSQAYPRETVRQLSECYTGVWERCVASVDPLPSAPTWYRSNRATLADLKNKLRISIDPHNVNYNVKWVKTNGLDNYTSVANQFSFTAGTTPPVLTSTGLLAYLKMPTNYFTYVPYRCLNGLGPFTNDTSVAYPHGYTNADTAAGGAFYPAGRTCWYTTDYGWNQIPAILRELTITLIDSVSGVIRKSDGDGSSSGWGAAKALAETDYTTEAWRSDIQAWQFGNYGYLGGAPSYIYYAQTRAAQYQWAQSPGGLLPASPKSCGEYYLYTVRIGSVYADPADNVYDDFGLGVVETNFAFVADDNFNALGGGTSTVWGAVGPLYPWCDIPTSWPHYAKWRGFVAYGSGSGVRGIRRWIVPGGFQFY